MYRTVALLILVCETGLFLSGQYHDATSIAIVIAYCQILRTACSFAPVSEIVFALLYTIVAATPLGSDVMFGFFGMYAVCIEWLVRSWYLPSIAFFVSSQVLAALTQSDGLKTSVISFLVGTVIIIVSAYSIRNHRSQMARVTSQAQADVDAAHKASDQLRQDLAVLLHDSTAKDLSRIALISRDLQSEYPDEPLLAQLADIASSASRRVRPLILNLTIQPHADTLTTIIAHAQQMLATRSITLDVDIPDMLDALISPQSQQCRIAGLVVREGATNILKYAPRGSAASLDIVDDGIALCITLSNTVSDNVQEGMTGGFGLRHLDEQVAAIDGTLSHMNLDGNWIVYATIPHERTADAITPTTN
ncbi:MAG: hypothetical protein SPI12_06290 [Actinomycetaceae bacterium]|nr:hypothetical protein [Actinomycetaceae bacterium]MDY6083446.1 hypothetical protein [Actinomycetaceae bacterium]